MSEYTSIDEKTINKQDKVISLFEYIKELNKIKQKIILKASDHLKYLPIKSFPDDPENIKIYYRDRTDDDNLSNESDVLLSVHKPEFQRCPEPDQSFSEWLNNGWDDYRNNVSVKEFILIPFDKATQSEDMDFKQLTLTNEYETFTIYFNDDSNRVNSYTEWIKLREIWVKKQELIEKTREFFTELYKLIIDLERESETLELIVADGFICDSEDPNIDHPILTRRVKIYHDAEKNTISIEDSNAESEIYTNIFQIMKNINLSSINKYISEFKDNDYHPLDRNETSSFLKTFAHQLSSSSIYSDTSIPDNWQNKERILIYRNPCYILRKRMDGTIKAIEQIIENVDETGDIPKPIIDLVEGGKIDIPTETNELSIDEQLASVGGESVDILLSKEANKEQLEIARRIEKYNAVLVQGPPGTGKTHTIANLMGHFLAQGKSVLVTSHTPKALSVLKEKVAPELQNLCVSMTDDTNVDMEKSIDGIINYLSATNISEEQKAMNTLAEERKNIIADLSSIRKKLYAILKQECNSIVYNGESISPSKAAAFVQENSETLSYIPGDVKLYEPLPLSKNELSDLYKSNEEITSQDEFELENNIPNPSEIMSPPDFEQACNSLNYATNYLKDISYKSNWDIQYIPKEKKIIINAPFGEITLNCPELDKVEQFKQYISSFTEMETWMINCAIDGKENNSFRNLWICLIEQIKKTCECSEILITEKFGKDVVILNNSSDYMNSVKSLLEYYNKNAKISSFAMLFNKQLKIGLSGATINGKQPQNADDCNLILRILELNCLKKQCAAYWDELIVKHGVPAFNELDSQYPERVAAKYIPLMERYIDWFENDYSVLVENMNNLGLPCNIIFQTNQLDTEFVAINKILSSVKNVLPILCDIFETAYTIADTTDKLEYNKNRLQSGNRLQSNKCKEIISAVETNDINAYFNAYNSLENIFSKYSIKLKREEYISKLSVIAPQWADAIRNRIDIHGTSVMPHDIEDAWRWKQYYGIIEEITAEPFSILQKKSIELSKRYRKTTAAYAEKCAWYHLLERTQGDISLQQALNGWKLTIKKIGKGTGKNAPKYRKEARKLMSKCQEAVPAWIMPMGKALESLSPKNNKFDIVIIDEASQSDISSLAILYMGKKLVIVGDDKQVSPLPIGSDETKINALKEMYIAKKIPNAHLYDARTSIYDIAATTFQPLMLREHFRCVPEIIGFSNWLSYDFKIKPLRDSSNSILLPAVVNYRVENGKRIDKTNPNEAKSIIALIQACIEQPEYENKTFGIISLLGNDQVKVLQNEIYKNINPKDCKKRRILCGNASNFQGDERDVIFLSVVDCANGNGPVSKMGFGRDDSYRKRYNVAASRAKDQLWVVHSFDPANDLKSGDIRKQLIEYSINPESVIVNNDKIEQISESPFEAEVAKYLSLRGYNLVQQWKVGTYRLDMVAICGKKKVAIECDGERYHSGENKIREDMERQTILERLGWRFIRIRGSEYYRNPNQTMERVTIELTELGIEPEDNTMTPNTLSRDTDLLQRVKSRAHKILNNENKDDAQLEIDVIESALDTKNDMGDCFTNEESDIDTNNTTDTSSSILIESKKENFNEINHNYTHTSEQLTIPFIDEPTTTDTDILKLLKSNNIRYVDKRPNGGCLWIIGGQELSSTVKKAKNLGFKFQFKPEGGRAIKNQPGWWTK